MVFVPSSANVNQNMSNKRDNQPQKSNVEERIFSCSAQAYCLGETQEWMELTDQPIPTHIIFNGSKQFYSIVCEHQCKALINSHLDLSINLVRSSLKFVQWRDNQLMKTYGLGFEADSDIDKLMAKVNEIQSEMKKKMFASGPNVAPLTESLATPLSTNIPDLKPSSVPSFDGKGQELQFANIQVRDLMKLESDKAKNLLSGGISNTSDYSGIIKKMEMLERENKNLRECIMDETNIKMNTVTSTSSNAPDIFATRLLLDRQVGFSGGPDDVTSLKQENRQLIALCNDLTKEKQSSEKKLILAARICKETRITLDSALQRISEVEMLLESEIKNN